MDIKELGKKLHELYFNAPKGKMVAMIHLFGIKYAKEIRESTFSKKDIAKEAGLRSSYHVEISKGVNLADYVDLKPNFKS